MAIGREAGWRLATVRTWGSRAFLLVNGGLCLALLATFGRHSGAFSDPWNGPTVATVVMAAATVALAAVTLMVGLLAVWGYVTIKEQASSIAREAADKAAREAAERVFKNWFARTPPSERDVDISTAYEREGGEDG